MLVDLSQSFALLQVDLTSQEAVSDSSLRSLRRASGAGPFGGHILRREKVLLFALVVKHGAFDCFVQRITPARQHGGFGGLNLANLSSVLLPLLSAGALSFRV